jgi:alpha-galactosidase
MNRAKDIKIGYIGGGSMNWAWAVMGDLALEPGLSGEVRLYDIDYESAKANETIGNNLNGHEETRGRWAYKACANLDEALTGADFVIISILPGTFDEMASDVNIPEEYGIYQSVGDTTGPAGVVRAMRTVPMMAEIAEAVRAYCPRAWVINYTNPMAASVSALYRAFPGIKAFGCCHEVFHIQSLLARLAEMETGEKVTKEEIDINVLGVNHFTWVDRADYRHMDLLPLFKDFAEKHAEKGYALNEARDLDQSNMFRNLNRVCFNLFLRFHAIPAAGDRHVAEFLPPWFFKNRETPLEWGFCLTPVTYRVKAREALLRKRACILAGEEAFPIKKSGEEGTKLMKALLGFGQMVANMNLPNTGQMKDIPAGVVVETNALVRRDAISPVYAGKLPDPVHLLVEKQAQQQEMLVRACMKRDTNLAFTVFLNDNLVQLDLPDAAELFGKMLENTKVYLRDWDIKGFR